MFPPYSFESTGQGAPFLGGAELHVQASGATEAGFEKFDEKFTATTFLQTTPSLSKIPRDEGLRNRRAPHRVGAGATTPSSSPSAARAAAPTCKVKDSLGKFDVPRSVVKAAQGDGTSTTTSSTSLSVSVARQRKEVKKDKHAKGELALTLGQAGRLARARHAVHRERLVPGLPGSQDHLRRHVHRPHVRPQQLRRVRQRLPGQRSCSRARAAAAAAGSTGAPPTAPRAARTRRSARAARTTRRASRLRLQRPLVLREQLHDGELRQQLRVAVPRGRHEVEPAQELPQLVLQLELRLLSARGPRVHRTIERSVAASSRARARRRPRRARAGPRRVDRRSARTGR